MRVLIVLPLLMIVVSLDARAQSEVPAVTHHARLTWQQRFIQANTAHDGHLTRDEAQHGYARIARHFADIDHDCKGFVTIDDIRAWHKSERSNRRQTVVHDDRMLPPQAAHRPSSDPGVPGATAGSVSRTAEPTAPMPEPDTAPSMGSNELK